MIKSTIDQLNKKTAKLNLSETLKFFYSLYGNKIVIGSSMSMEDQIILNEAIKISKDFNIFTIDTGRLPQETYDLINETNKKYGIKIKIYFPNYKDVEYMINKYGPNPFYESIEKRKLCCEIRKVKPLRRALKGYKAWCTGLRREQSLTRRNIKKIEWDENNNVIKINPLIEWTIDDIWDYVKKENILINKLHYNNYPSIGCAPCTRLIKEGEDIRAGRWWWENNEQKECGIHIKDKKIIRLKEDNCL